MSILNDFLKTYGQRDGVFAISEARFFAHPEEAYDAQYGIDKLALDSYREEGTALLDLCDQFGYDSSKPALEIGCGTGRLSMSLAFAGRLTEILITDPSPAFCSMTARKIGALPPPFPQAYLAVLNADDLDRLPKDTFSLIALRSVLHHILDIDRFFADCSALLSKGGILLFEEPCYEGYLLMGAITQCMPDVLRAHGIVLNEKHAADIRIFAEGMRFYARRDIDKSAAEDKHLFRTDELMRICEKCGMRLEMFPNRMFANIRQRDEPLPEQYFEHFYYRYLKYALAWDEDLIALFEKHAKKYLEYFSVLSLGGAAPYTYGTFLCQKSR
jgi:ubiquinone/menaquinone biosynthesis C-methylase UbiE